MASRDSLVAGVGVVIGMIVVNQVDTFLSAYKCGCPPTGALAVLLFAMPKAPASTPRAVILSHAIATVSAVAVNAVYSGFIEGFVPATSHSLTAALGLATVLMMEFKCLNPPACAYAAIACGQNMGLKDIATGPGMIGALVLLAAQKAYFATADATLKSKTA